MKQSQFNKIMKLYIYIVVFYTISIFVLNCINDYYEERKKKKTKEGFRMDRIASQALPEMEKCDGIVFGTDGEQSCLSALFKWIIAAISTTGGYVILFICSVLVIVVIFAIIKGNS